MFNPPMTDTKILATKPLVENLLAQTVGHTEKLKQQGIIPHLIIVAVGKDPASEIYMKHKLSTAERCGISTEILGLAADISQSELDARLKSLSDDKAINGIVLQLPVPEHLDSFQAVGNISPYKDVDGLTATNTGKYITQAQDVIYPATPLGVMRIIDWQNFDLVGKNVVVVGRSHLVGIPTANLISLRNATVTSCHKQTQDITIFTQQADLIVSATGCVDLIKGKDIKAGAMLIDVGISPDPDPESKKIHGDVCKDCHGIAGAITPVPGGVGPMTVISLMTNTVDATCLQNALPRPTWNN